MLAGKDAMARADLSATDGPSCSVSGSNPRRFLFLPRLAMVALLMGAATTVWTLFPSPLSAGSPLNLDEWGGHFDEATNYYHYHRPKMDMARRKREYLTWLKFPFKGAIKGIVTRIDRPNALWIRIPYRPAYQEMAPLISSNNRDDKAQLLRIWLQYVSPEETGSRGRRYSKWFKKKVIYEMAQKLEQREITVQFNLLGGSALRLRGMVFLGEENVNLWLVLNGWSYYVINEGGNPHDKLFKQAEDLALRDKAGIWRPAQ